MDYAEHPPPESLHFLVKASWTLSAAGAPGDWLEHRAVPDGCIEIIRRVQGRSRWNGDQPEYFVVGLIDSPATFSIETGSRFAAVRIWPWTWPLLSRMPLASLRGRWAPAGDPALAALCRCLDDRAAATETLATALACAPDELRRIGRAVIEAQSVAGLRASTGWNERRLQRWFGRNVGLPPRLYLRMLRFERAFVQAPAEPSLADHAASQGFADQAHMTREFRALAGASPGRARQTSKGPFLR